MPDPTQITGEPVAETLARVVRLGFGGESARFAQFVQTLRDVTPPDVYVMLRGSSVSGVRWTDGEPFDADGPGTSDLDLTFVGAAMLERFEDFYIPGLHSAPLCDERPEASPTLAPVRRTLSSIAGRPVNIQATSDLVQYVRDVTMQQPYVILIERQDEEAVPTANTAGPDQTATDTCSGS